MKVRNTERAVVPGMVAARSDSAASGGVAPLFRLQGLTAVHACVLDAETIVCEARWTITEDGSVQDAAPDLDFARSMTTIIRLNRTGSGETVTRQLTPQRWAFGWEVDERRVVVAEAWYRDAREAPTDAETALVRRLCDARVRLIDHGVEIGNKAAALPAIPDEPKAEPDASPRLSAEAGSAAERAAEPRGWKRSALPSALLLLCLAAGGLGYGQWRRSEALAAEAQRLQALSQATLAQGLATMLERGDYGEVQAELDRFHDLRYFEAALVLNARGQVVAKSATASSMRIGEPLKAESLVGSRPIDLRTGAGQDLGRLHLWPHRGKTP